MGENQEALENDGPLLWVMKDLPAFNNARGFADELRRVQTDRLVAAYRHDRAIAPRRPRVGKSYLVPGHDGRPGSGLFTNRSEEHLALALFNQCAHPGGLLVRPDFLRLHVIDYAVPLKARQTDPIGELDLLGLLGDGRLCIIELKSPKGRGDSPLRALLEALSYTAVIEANRAAFDEEVRERHPDASEAVSPMLLLLGPVAWWNSWKNCAPAGAWVPPFSRLCTELSVQLGLEIACGALDPHDPGDLRPGLEGERPTLVRIPDIVPVDGLPKASPPQDSAQYLASLLRTLHRYARMQFPPESFDGPLDDPARPPVFRLPFVESNLIAPADPEARKHVINAIPFGTRHEHFASMRSSQALTQSFFASLAATDHLALLGPIEAECGRPAFDSNVARMAMTLERSVQWLGEPRSTSVDVWFEAEGRCIAVECKLSEEEFGTCSRPRVARTDPSFCDGTYTRQLERRERCALSEIGVAYWRHVPEVLNWSTNEDLSPCPLAPTYQVVRNLLAVGTAPGRRGHVLLVYDARNPSFASGGAAREVIVEVRRSLLTADLLRTVTWQTLIAAIAVEPELDWLTRGLADKYGFFPGWRGQSLPPKPARFRPGGTPTDVAAHSLPKLSLVLMPRIDPGHLLLSVRGQSYRLRSPRRSDWGAGFILPEARTTAALIRSGEIEHLDRVTESRSVAELDWWRTRLEELDRAEELKNPTG